MASSVLITLSIIAVIIIAWFVVGMLSFFIVKRKAERTLNPIIKKALKDLTDEAFDW